MATKKKEEIIETNVELDDVIETEFETSNEETDLIGIMVEEKKEKKGLIERWIGFKKNNPKKAKAIEIVSGIVTGGLIMSVGYEIGKRSGNNITEFIDADSIDISDDVITDDFTE